MGHKASHDHSWSRTHDYTLLFSIANTYIKYFGACGHHISKIVSSPSILMPNGSCQKVYAVTHYSSLSIQDTNGMSGGTLGKCMVDLKINTILIRILNKRPCGKHGKNIIFKNRSQLINCDSMGQCSADLTKTHNGFELNQIELNRIEWIRFN